MSLEKKTINLLHLKIYFKSKNCCTNKNCCSLTIVNERCLKQKQIVDNWF